MLPYSDRPSSKPKDQQANSPFNLSGAADYTGSSPHLEL